MRRYTLCFVALRRSERSANEPSRALVRKQLGGHPRNVSFAFLASISRSGKRVDPYILRLLVMTCVRIPAGSEEEEEEQDLPKMALAGESIFVQARCAAKRFLIGPALRLSHTIRGGSVAVRFPAFPSSAAGASCGSAGRRPIVARGGERCAALALFGFSPAPCDPSSVAAAAFHFHRFVRAVVPPSFLPTFSSVLRRAKFPESRASLALARVSVIAVRALLGR